MKTKKLRLNKETLRYLDARNLRGARAAGTQPAASCVRCTALCSVAHCLDSAGQDCSEPCTAACSVYCTDVC